MLRFLSQHAEVLLGCVADEPWEPEHEEALKQFCSEVSIHRLPPRGRWIRAAAGLATGRSATAGAFYSRSLAQQVKQWTSGDPLDAAIIYCSSMGSYRKAFQTRPQRVLVDLVDVDSQKWIDYSHSTRGFKRWLYLHEAGRVRRLERRLSVEADAVSVVSPDEAELYRVHHAGMDAHAISNGVDHDYFAPDALHQDHWSLHRHGDPQMVFVGVLDYLPNVQGLQWFCETVLPQIMQEFPGALLEIVGRRPAPAVKELQRMPGVRLVGEVADVRPHVLAADLAIAPLQIARGIQNKVLEALACGRPVIATPEAATGIESRGGLFVAESPSEWLTAIQRLRCEHQNAAAQHSARHGILDQYSWEARLSPILEMLDLNRSNRLDREGWKIAAD